MSVDDVISGARLKGLNSVEIDSVERCYSNWYSSYIDRHVRRDMTATELLGVHKAAQEHGSAAARKYVTSIIDGWHKE